MTYHIRTRQILAGLGLAPVELEALDHPPRHEVPLDPRGFGLLGTAGTGKTWTLVRLVANHVEQLVRRQPDPSRAHLLWIEGDVARDGRVRWVHWPRLAREIQDRRFEGRWRWDLGEALEDYPVLVLDDLGRETRLKGEDPAFEVLQRVVEHRHRRRMQTYWTSNLTREEFCSFYGGPLSSRILGTWPDYQVDGQDMRLFTPLDLKAAAGGESC